MKQHVLGNSLALRLDKFNFRRSALAETFNEIMRTCRLNPDYWTEQLGFSNRLLEEEPAQLDMESNECLPTAAELSEVINRILEEFSALQKQFPPPLALENIRRVLYECFIADVPGFKKRIFSFFFQERLPMAAYFLAIYLSSPKKFTTTAVHTGRKKVRVANVCLVCKTNFLARRKFCSDECKQKSGRAKTGKATQ